MDANTLFSKLDANSSQSTLWRLKQLFFTQKTNEIKEGIWSRSIGEVTDINIQNAYIDSLRTELPEAEFISGGAYSDNLWVRMKNVDFVIIKSTPNQFEFFDKNNSTPVFKDSDGITNLMRKFDNAMPEWEAEFRAFCTENQQKIDKIETKRLSRYDKFCISKEYLKGKIGDFACMHRKLLPYMNAAVLNSLANSGMQCNGTKCSMTNTTIDIGTQKMNGVVESVVSFDLSAYGTNCSIGLYPAEVLLEIDRRIPQWVDEAKNIAYEFQKQKKIDEINKNTTKILIKNKLREMGCQYRISEYGRDGYSVNQSKIEPTEFVLEVKLQKNRKLVVNIPFNCREKVNNILDALSAHIAAINSVPMKYRIKNQSVGREIWES